MTATRARDVQATLAELTARVCADDVRAHARRPAPNCWSAAAAHSTRT